MVFSGSIDWCTIQWTLFNTLLISSFEWFTLLVYHVCKAPTIGILSYFEVALIESKAARQLFISAMVFLSALIISMLNLLVRLFVMNEPVSYTSFIQTKMFRFCPTASPKPATVWLSRSHWMYLCTRVCLHSLLCHSSVHCQQSKTIWDSNSTTTTNFSWTRNIAKHW